jgi:DNA invertase Pin-like site-specific DNA recombinase
MRRRWARWLRRQILWFCWLTRGAGRVSTAEQILDLQRDALVSAGCAGVWEETASEATDSRPKLTDLLDTLLAGDTLVVWRLDRLGRSLRHLIETVADLEARGVGFRSLEESIDTTTPGGKLVFHLFGSLAEFERSLVRSRTVAGLAAAKKRGRVGGRPPVMTPQKLRAAQKLHRDGTSIPEIAQTLGVGRTTVYRHLQERAETAGRGVEVESATS